MKADHFLVVLMLSSVEVEVEAGCRWHSPAWEQSLESAPLVNISDERIVTVSWDVRQIEEKAECVDKFDVGVRNMAEDEERKLCSVPAKLGQTTYQCKLDLSKDKYCDNKFGFWVIAVNMDYNRGVERVQTFADTIVEVSCDEEQEARQEKVLSVSCLALTPAWTSRPYIQQIELNRLQISWDIRQLSSSHCISFFQLKYWHSSDFVPQPTTVKFGAGSQTTGYEGVMKVMPCTTYTYLLTMAFSGRKTSDIQGDIKIPCSGENFMEPIGLPFNSGKNEAENTELEEGSMKSAKALQDNKEMIEEISLEKELTVVGEGESVEPKADKVIGIEMKENKKRFRPPKMIAVDSGPESLTWQLTKVDPAVKIEKYQVSCWDKMTNIQRDLPCCQVEEEAPGKGWATETNLTVSKLEPNTSYTCQGGMLVEGAWHFSPKALRMTQNSAFKSGNILSILLMTLGTTCMLRRG